MKIEDIKPVETKEVNITKYFSNPQGEVKIKIKHFSVWQRNEINEIITDGQEYDDEKKKVIIKNTKYLNKIFMKEMLYGILVDKDFPFENWDENFIKALDERNPDLVDFIHQEIQDFNNPLVKKSG